MNPYPTCENCGSSMPVEAGQKLSGDKIWWHVSYSCPSCDLRIEEDGQDPSPGEICRMILLHQGSWELRVLEQPRNLPAVLKRIRETLRLTMAETARLKERVPGTLFTGTRTETERLRKVLRALLGEPGKGGAGDAR